MTYLTHLASKKDRKQLTALLRSLTYANALRAIEVGLPLTEDEKNLVKLRLNAI